MGGRVKKSEAALQILEILNSLKTERPLFTEEECYYILEQIQDKIGLVAPPSQFYGIQSADGEHLGWLSADYDWESEDDAP